MLIGVREVTQRPGDEEINAKMELILKILCPRVSQGSQRTDQRVCAYRMCLHVAMIYCNELTSLLWNLKSQGLQSPSWRLRTAEGLVSVQ